MDKVNYKAILTIIIILNYLAGNSQTSLISGVRNNYAKVTSISSDKAHITISSPDSNKFKANDTVLIVQMKGADYLTSDNTFVSMNSTGQYEFIGIENISMGQITLRSYIIHNYDVSQFVQLVRVPSYQSAIVTDTLSCTPWDSTKGYGGILALIINDTLNLRSSVDVSGLGFKGGDTTVYMGGCESVPWENNFYGTTDSAGLKGEGFCWSNFGFTRGNGAKGNAGGGGDGKYSGGGGGAGSGYGGNGGQESVSCTDPNPDGSGGGLGLPPPYQFFKNDTNNSQDLRIFMGGGGGAGNGPLNSAGTQGGNGGGIVFIITHFLKTNGNYIESNGQSVTATTKNSAGAGGGGGGGSVVIVADSVIGELNVQVQGGNGGNTSVCSGQGGGGGGGFIWTSFLNSNNFNINLKKGSKGTFNGCYVYDYDGHSGSDSLGNYKPVLNGFLYNIISGQDTICWGGIPKIIGGTTPRGGSGQYTYQWIQLDSSKNTKWDTIPGADSINYQSGPLFNTTYFKRIVASFRYFGDTTRLNGSLVPNDTVTDKSKLIKVNVLPEIIDSITTGDTLLCYGNIIQVKARPLTGGGSGKWTYNWFYSRNNTNNWETVPEADTTYAYTIKTVPDYYYYKRIASRNGCSRSDSIKLTVYPAIFNDSIWLSQTICSGTMPDSIHGSKPSGGVAGTYWYNWQLSDPGNNWSDTSVKTNSLNPGVQTNSGAHPKITHYRRIVYSGLNNIKTCIDTATSVYIDVVPIIKNDSIQNQDTIICAAEVPGIFTGTNPSGGTGSYIFQWFQKQNSGTWDIIQGPGTDQQNYTSVPLYDTTSFRRVVLSGSDSCCRDTSALIIITVQPSIQNNIISGDTIICQKQLPELMTQKGPFPIGGNGPPYHYQWQSTDNINNWTSSDIKGDTDSNYQSGTLFDTTYFRRVVSSGACARISDTLIVAVLDSIKNNILTGYPYVCVGSVPKTISSPALTGGNGKYSYLWEESTSLSGSWRITPGNDSVADYSSNSNITDTTYYRRIVASGYKNCCKSISSPFTINLIHPPVNNGAGINIIDTFKFTVPLNAPAPENADTTYWTASEKGIIFTDSTMANDTVKNLKLGVNVLKWNVISRRVCPVVTDSVTITVKDLVRYDGFSPNHDGLNDYFILGGLKNVDDGVTGEMKIFNRSGILVYSSDHYDNKSDNYDSKWDGTNPNGDPVPDDTYFYILKVNFLEGESRVYKGFVVLKR